MNEYVLPARPPMMNLIVAYFMAHVGSDYQFLQVSSLFLSTLVFFACIAISGLLVAGGNRRVWLIAAVLATSPVFAQNVSYPWTKLLAAFFIIFSLALYVRGWRGNSPLRIVAAAGSMAAGLLVHYSAGPYALFLALHYAGVFAWRRKKLAEVAGSIAVAGSLAATWFGFALSVYGKAATFGSNTTVTGSQSLTLGEPGQDRRQRVHDPGAPFFENQTDG